MTIEEQAAEAMERREPQVDPEPEPQKPTGTNVARPPSIPAESDGRLVGSTFEDQFRLARAYHASGLMPKALSSPEKVLVALQMCRELGLPPMTSVGKIMVLNGTPSLFGEMPLALVRRSKLMNTFREEFMSDPKGELAGARCVTGRAGDEGLVVREFTIDDARDAGLWGKAGPWKLYPKRMLQLRARSWNLKDNFPDVLLGLSILEYDANATVENGEVITTAENKAASLVERFN